MTANMIGLLLVSIIVYFVIKGAVQSKWLDMRADYKKRKIK